MTTKKVNSFEVGEKREEMVYMKVCSLLFPFFVFPPPHSYLIVFSI